MPPKKVEEPERKPLIGRVGTNLKVGIVGIPNVGKSTFFNVLTKSQAAAENFPFCTIDPNEKIELKGRTLEDDKGYDKIVSSWPSSLSTWCPRASIYYAYTEDINPFDRINGFAEIEEKNSGDHVPHFDPPLDPFTIREPYEENDAREKYLRTNPVCFAIFGKPGLKSNELAKLIAEWWKCVLISPEALVKDEIEKETDKGQWIEDILENEGTIGPDIIMNLIESRIKKRDVMHRGYVVEGLPLIPDNSDLRYSSCPEKIDNEELSKKCCTVKSTCRIESNSNSSLSKSTGSLNSIETSVNLASSPLKKFNYTGNDFHLLRNIRRSTSFDSLSFLQKPTNIIGTGLNLLQRTNIQETRKFGKETAEMHVRINPFDNEANGKVSPYEKYEDYVPDQINTIFNDWPVKPTVIIYIICPDDDVIQRHMDFTFNSVAGESVDAEFTGTNDFSDNRLENYLSKRRIEEETSVKFKCEIYKRHALPIIDRYVLKHNPQNVIRVDGRTLVAQMFQIVNTKLRTLPLSRAIIPKRIGNRIGWEADDSFEGERDDELLNNEIAEENFEDRSNEEIFKDLSNKSTISLRFRWNLSTWKFTCPVELTQGRTIEGKAEHAVRFMNKIFFLSSHEAMEIFLENPRPFILPMRPNPSYKIAVFGPRYSGKSELCKALARNFGANVINVRELEKGIIDDRIDANIAGAIREALDRIITDLKKRLEAERESRENARHEALNFWLTEVKQFLKELDRIHQSDFSEEHSKDLTIIHQNLQKHGLEILKENSELLEDIKRDERILYEYAPENLRFQESPIHELSEHDPEVALILENEVKHLRNDKITVTSAEIAGLLISRIKLMPDLPLDNGLLKEPGWIIDGMYPDPEIWRILIEAGVVIDHVILIIEEQPYENLIDKWKQYNDVNEEVEEDNEHEIEEEEEYIHESRLNKNIESYIIDIREFEENWQSFREVLEETGKNPLICNINDTSNMYEIISKHINNDFSVAAKIMSKEEREREFEDAIESMIDTDEEEELEDKESNELLTKQVEKDNRRLGDTGIYCPVALARHRVLWRGKEEYSALYLDKIYLCSSAEALNDFVKNPEVFKVPFKKPMTKIPPARICIVGPSGSGKSTLAKILSKEFNMIHIDFSDRLNAYLRDRGIIPNDWNKEEQLEAIDLPRDLTDNKYNIDSDTILAFLQKYKKEGATLPQIMLEECFLKFFKSPYDTSATIFDSFPNCLEDVDATLKNCAAPELVIELECNMERTQERLLPGILKSRVEKQEAPKNIEREEEEEEDEDNTEHELSEDDPEDVKERILQEIQESYDRTNELLTSARNRMEEESIPWIKMNGEKNVNTLLSSLRRIIHPLIFRESSIFERTYEIDSDIAEDLLESGYYFLSSFGRSCPVQMYKKKIPFQLYLPMDDRDKIYSVLHRQYIYFIADEESLKMFTNDPLKYLQQDSCDPVIPARISIIGPPKSGKSTIAQRFAGAYGVRVITREDALRWSKINYSWTKTGSLIKDLLQFDQEIKKNLVARAVELYLMDPASSTQGYILDGFPTNREETEELAFLNIRSMIVINLQADENFCLSSSAMNYEDKKQNPADNILTLISRRYDTWKENSSIYLDWLKKFAQNVVDVDATRSKWAVWRDVDREICTRFADVKRYFREADYEKVHCLKNLCVSPYEFKSRQSPCESYCPVCLHYEDSMNFSGAPPDRRGVVQFRKYFYWICPRHLEIFIKNPQACLPPQSTANLPSERPQILNEEIDVEHACWVKRLRASGNCIVTYADALPEYQVVPGEPNISVLYKNNLYLFCSLKCREKFCLRSSMYSNIEIVYREISPSVELKYLPTVNFLKQTVADAIVKAVTEAATVRPKYPGMSPAISAAIYIGVYLKIHNVDCTIDEIDVYKEIKRRMEFRNLMIKIATKNMKKMINPHVTILSYMHAHTLTQFVSVQARRVPVPDSRYDYLCEYFKPASKVPAFLTVVDIAGLVKGAAEGQGLGNNFLSHISACDAIFHLCRAFEDDDVTHIEGEVNPVRDLEIISEELRLKDIEFLGGHLEKLEKLVVRGNDKKLKPEYDTVLKVKNILIEEKKHIRFADWSVNEIEILNKYLFLTSKPVIYLVNLSEKDYIRKKNKWLIKIKEWVDKNDPGASLIPFSGAFENKIIDMDDGERSKYFEESKITSALDKIIVQGYKALQLQYFFTAGADEVKAWTIQKGTKAPQAAGKIHTDFEKGFIMAEVMKFDDFKNEGSESGVKAAGKYRQQGRNYVVEDGDIIFFKFNAGAGLKDPKKK